MRSQFTCLVYALLSIVTLTVDARKTFAVKEGIANGNMMVHSPRVMAYDCMWCFFKDKNNNFCVSGDLNWKVASSSSRSTKETKYCKCLRFTDTLSLTKRRNQGPGSLSSTSRNCSITPSRMRSRSSMQD